MPYVGFNLPFSFLAGSLAVGIFLVFVGPATEATGKENPQAAGHLSWRGVDYKVEYQEQKDPRTPGCAEISVRLSAQDSLSQVRVWEHTVGKIWGQYNLSDVNRLGFQTEKLKIIERNHGAQVLLLCRGNIYFLFDSARGENILMNGQRHFDRLPVSSHSTYRFKEIRFDEIQALPGYGVRIEAENSGPGVILSECFYFSLLHIEGRITGTQNWELAGKYVNEREEAQELQMLEPGKNFDLFLHAETFEELLKAVGGDFATLAGRETGPFPKMKPGRSFSKGRYDAFRIGIVLCETDADGSFINVAKNYITIPMEAVEQLLAPRSVP